MIVSKFPGKLFLIGEYSAIVPGATSVIASVSKSLTVSIKEASTFEIRTGFGNLTSPITFEDLTGPLRYVKAAIVTAQNYAKSTRPFEMNIESDLEHQGVKYGFGSSGVVVVAVIDAILRFNHISYSKMDLFKLAILCQKKLGLKGSGGDIASAIYQGVIAYTRYDDTWLENHYNDEDIVQKEWPLLQIEPLTNQNIDIVVGWTQKQNATEPYVEIFEDFFKKDSALFREFYVESQNDVKMFVDAWETRDANQLDRAVNHYRQWMKKLQEVLNIEIETPLLSALIDEANQLGYPAKISGSGGGDCGIVFDLWNDFENLEKLGKMWSKHDIVKLEIEVV